MSTPSWPALRPARHSGVHVLPAGKKLGRATGWHGHGQFAAAVGNARLKAEGEPLAG